MAPIPWHWALPGCVLSYLIQTWPRFLRPYFGVDVWRHFSITEYVRKHRWLPKELPQYMLKGPYDYPPLMLIILSIFPKKLVERWNGFFAPVIDLLHLLLVFGIAYRITGRLDVSLLAQGLYLTTPQVILENASLTPRGMGSLLVSLVFLSGFMSTPSPMMVSSLMVTAILVAATLLTSKMAAQTVFLLSFGFAVASKSFWPIACVGAGFILATICSGGFYITVLKGHLAVLGYFRRIRQDRYAHQVRGLGSRKAPADFVGRINMLIARIPFSAMLGANPAALAGFVLAIGLLLGRLPPDLRGADQTALRLFSVWIVGGYALGLVTAHVPFLKFMGEGMKYMMYLALPSSVLVACWALPPAGTGRPLVLIATAILMFASLCQAVLLQYRIILQNPDRNITPPLWKIFSFLNAQPAGTRVATIPFGIADAIAYFTHCDVLSSDSGHVLGNNPDYTDYYPRLRRPLAEILKKHGIRYLVVNRHYVEIEELRLQGYPVALEAGNFTVLSAPESNR